ncbi:MAG: hypothetical protein JWN02_1213 [Acidobacteria bacterium]|nr:hypothetical protein [Acidobacteriota bacterium]
MARSAALMLLFWMLAALLVVGLPHLLAFTWPFAVATVKVGAIVLAGCGYMKVDRGSASLERALVAGAVWLLLDIVAEAAVAARLGRGWFELIGSPAVPLLRTWLLVTWIAAPALFARQGGATAAVRR